MPDLIYILNQLVDVKGNILIPKISDDVELLNEKEKEIYDKIQFDVDTYINEIGASKPLQETKVCYFNLNNVNNIPMFNKLYFSNNY